MPKEEYTLNKVEKIPGGDLFMITARIKYGDKDLEVLLENLSVGDEVEITANGPCAS